MVRRLAQLVTLIFICLVAAQAAFDSADADSRHNRPQDLAESVRQGRLQALLDDRADPLPRKDLEREDRISFRGDRADAPQRIEAHYEDVEGSSVRRVIQAAPAASAVTALERATPRQRALQAGGAAAALADTIPDRVKSVYTQAVATLSAVPVLTYVVEDPGDAPDDSIEDGIFFPRTLRSAIQNANETPALDRIVFDDAIDTIIISGNAELFISQPIQIDGKTGTSDRVTLSGSGLDVGTPTLWLNTGGSVIQNLEVANGAGPGIQVGANAGITSVVRNCEIHGNNGAGINMNFCSNNWIGSDTAGNGGNLVYGNTGTGGIGISVISANGSNVIIGNYVGTVDGVTAAPNSRYGVNLDASANIVFDNLLSGNDRAGLQMDGSSSLVQANFIGTTADGLSSLTNGQSLNSNGIEMFQGFNDTIRGNLVSGNNRSGISLGYSASGTLVEDNLIGVDALALNRLGNWESGIEVAGFNATIRNNIVGDNLRGILIQSGGVNSNIYGNLIGTSGVLDSAVGNNSGIRIVGSNNTIGSANPAERNIISGNNAGIEFRGQSCSSNVVIGNYVGLDESGTAVIYNWWDGVMFTQGASNNRLENNVISGNLGAGIWFTQRLNQLPTGNEVLGNLIGTDYTGTQPIPNNWSGIWIDYGRDNVFGGPDAEANTIAANDSGGIYFIGGVANEFYNNYIGTNSAGDSLGNKGYGIYIDATRGEAVDSNQFGAPGVVLGNTIVANDSAGIVVRGSMARDNLFLGNVVGTLRDSTTRLPNAHGVVIDSATGSEFGSTTPGGGNLIAGNTGDGVRILAGSENTFRANVIYGNGGRGIDLGGDGITPNDSLDLDSGPNALLNYPVVDSGYLVDTITSEVFGTYHGRPNESFILDLYLNRECDSLRYGEGERWVDSLRVTTDASGYVSWQIQIPEIVDTGRILTMAATDTLGNTSEFSACWPYKILRIRDFAGDPIGFQWFQLSRVDNDPPTFTEHPIDSFFSDLSGRILLSSEDAEIGDTIRVFKHLVTLAAQKHVGQLATRVTWTIDNIDYDSVTFDVKFTELDSALAQSVTVAQPMFAYNLLVSIEWDASPAYLAELQTSFRELANYLYDVYDGQLRLDTIMVYDDRMHWDSADVRIHANNIEWPRATAGGILVSRTWANVKLPRTWWGTTLRCRQQSAVEFPPAASEPRFYRGIGHELGHYILKFYDEYQFPDGGTRCSSVTRYGYMDSQYKQTGASSSELSWSRQYEDSASCRNTKQWKRHGASCWDYFESLWEQEFNDMTLSVIEAAERPLNGADYFLGPNDNLAAPNYDVSRFLVFVDNTAPYYTKPSYLTVTDPSSFGLDKIAVVHLRTNQGRAMLQGYAAPSGKIIALGTEPVDTLFAGGAPGIITVDSAARRRPVANGFDWYYGQAAVPVGDSLTLQLQQVVGHYPLVIGATIDGASEGVTAEFAQAFTSAPSVQAWPDGVPGGEEALATVGDAYTATLTTPAGDGGFLRFLAVDSAAQSYFLDVDYAVAEPDSADAGEVYEVKARGGDGEFDLDTAAGSVERMMLLSSPYPVIRTGLSANALQAGRTHAVATYPLTAYAGAGQVSIFYDDSAVKDTLAGWDLEPTLRVHRWNDVQNQWEVVGGYVDTALDFVSVSVDVPGVYAAFTTDVPCGVIETGDVDQSGSVITSDIIYLVNFIFKAGPEPLPCVGAGDVNCDGNVITSDIIYLVNYVLKGGVAPCDVCALTPGVWYCP